MPNRSNDLRTLRPAVSVQHLIRRGWASLQRLAQTIGLADRRPTLGEETSEHLLRDVGLLDGRSRPRPGERDPLDH